MNAERLEKTELEINELREEATELAATLGFSHPLVAAKGLALEVALNMRREEQSKQKD